MKHIVKRKGHKEEFDERKVYASVYSACMNVHLHEQESEKVAEQVCKDIKKWINKRKTVSSREIFHKVTRSLESHNKDAAFMYETHMDIS